MSRYELYLLVHIIGATVWVGGGFMLVILGAQAERSKDDAKLEQWLRAAGPVTDVAFIAASLLVLAMGVLMVVDGPWSFGDLWISLGLAGYAATLATGLLVLNPWSKRIDRIVERDGGFSAEAAMETRKFLLVDRLETTVLFLVIADMVLKPDGGDVATLAGMAAVLVVAVAVVGMRLRSFAPTAPSPT